MTVGNNPLYTERELAHQLADAGIKMVTVSTSSTRSSERFGTGRP